VLLNYRQTETAFWSTYLPTVIGHLVPTYPPVTEVSWKILFPAPLRQIDFGSWLAEINDDDDDDDNNSH